MDRTQRGGRNAICPKCGEKNKNCQCDPLEAARKRRSIGTLVGALVIIVAVALINPAKLLMPKPAAAPPPDAIEFRQTMDHYLDAHNRRDEWWLINSQPPPEELNALIKQMSTQEEIVKQAIEQYRSVSPLTTEIAEAFPKFYFSLTIGGSSVTHSRKKNATDIQPISGQEIAFIPLTEKTTHPAMMYYDPTIKRLALCGITWPVKVLPGLLYQDLGHALYHQAGKPSALAPQGSDLYVQEEVEMHELANEVFNKATNGAYYQTVDSILDQRRPDNWQDAVLGVTPSELQQLDKVLGCENAGEVVANVMGGRYPFTLGIRYITRDTMTPEVKDAWKVQLYRFLHEQAQH